MIKKLLSTATLMSFPLLAAGANTATDTTTILIINESSSILTYNPSYWDEPRELINANFGGLVRVLQTDYYIDTKHDGTPSYEPLTLRNISINFPTLDLPPEVSGFSPIYSIGPFNMFGTEISGFEWNFCALETAMGYMCSNTTLHWGVPESLVGTFDGTHLIIDGYLSHDWSGGYYSFHVEASPVPLPSALALFASGIAAAFGMLRFKASNKPA